MYLDVDGIALSCLEQSEDLGFFHLWRIHLLGLITEWGIFLILSFRYLNLSFIFSIFFYPYTEFWLASSNLFSIFLILSRLTNLLFNPSTEFFL